jgi:hypothetical protein
MKFFNAILVYVVIAFFLCWGILLAVKGQYWLLIAAAATYLLGLGVIGCLPKKTH